MCSNLTWGTTVKVGILYGANLNSVNVKSMSANHLLIVDTVTIQLNDSNAAFTLLCENDSVYVTIKDSIYYKGKKVQIIGIDNAELELSSPKIKKAKYYYGNILVTNQSGFLFFVNEINIERYLPGVLEAEVGANRPPEFYKVQAIICRTYVLSHMRRHEMEDFNVCDQVHCQVYMGISKKSTEIIKAVEKTHDIVMVDEDFELITAAFHANCGGQTVNSEDVWNKKLSYLRGVKDTFCLRQTSAVWNKEIGKEKWVSGLKKNCERYTEDRDSLFSTDNYKFLQFSRKRNYDASSDCMIPLKDLRTTFNLRSTYFHAYAKNGQIHLAGRGFGHGVGLCQDGAINMAKLGYSYKSILHFYYQNVGIVHLDELDFFRFSE